MRTGRYTKLFYCLLFIFCASQVSAQVGQCPANIDFEFGDFTNWTCYTGSVAQINGANVVTVSPSSPTPDRHTIIDNSFANTVDPYGGFPVLCPNGSGFSIKLGNNQTNRQAERVSYKFTIPSSETEYSLVYQYAVVFQDPNHLPQEQPRFTARIYDSATNEYVSCATFDFIATSNLPGFIKSNVAANVWYKPWTSVTLNLTGYAGKTVMIEFTTADCTQGAHFGYAYIDINIGCTSPVRGASFCPGTTALTLNAPFGYQSYAWYNADMTRLLGTEATLTLSPPPAVNTVFALDIIPFPGFGCRDTVFTTVKPADAPVANAGADKSICYGTRTSIGTPAQPNMRYNWFPSTGLDNPNIANPTASPQATTDYILTVTNSQSDCVRQDTVNVKVAPQLFSGFSINASGQCINNNNFQFTNNNAPGINYLWRFGDESNSSQFSATHTYASPGIYNVRLVTSVDGCLDSTSKDVEVYSLPTGSITAPALNICESIPVVLSASGGANYNWFRDGQQVGTTNGNFSALDPGKYKVNIIDQHGCQNAGSNDVTLTITRKPAADFSFDKYCIGLPTTFINKSSVANSAPVTYAWEFGNGDVSIQKDPVLTYMKAGAYNVKLSITPQVCPQLITTLQKTVTIDDPIPGISYVPKNAVEKRPLQLTARDIGLSYEWMPSIYLGSIFGSRTVYTGDKEQLYLVKMITPSGCTTIDTQMVKIFKEQEIYMPKAFTPNGDGHNDRMYPFLVGIKELKSFRIINRWGTVVYESKTDLPGWDGTYKGKAQPMDGYVWEALAIDIDGKTILRKGSFTLIR